MKISTIVAISSIFIATAASANRIEAGEWLAKCSAAYAVTSAIHKQRGSAEGVEYGKIAIAFHKGAIAEIGDDKATRVVQETYRDFMGGVQNNDMAKTKVMINLVKEGCPAIGSALKVARFL